MAALILADELFDARADVDELLEGRDPKPKSLLSRITEAAADPDDGIRRTGS